MARPTSIVPAEAKKWCIVRIQWEDAVTAFGPGVPSEHASRYASCLRDHVGHFLGSYGGSVHLTDCRDGDDSCDGITSIPLSLVRQFQVLK